MIYGRAEHVDEVSLGLDALQQATPDERVRRPPGFGTAPGVLSPSRLDTRSVYIHALTYLQPWGNPSRRSGKAIHPVG